MSSPRLQDGNAHAQAEPAGGDWDWQRQSRSARGGPHRLVRTGAAVWADLNLISAGGCAVATTGEAADRHSPFTVHRLASAGAAAHPLSLGRCRKEGCRRDCTGTGWHAKVHGVRDATPPPNRRVRAGRIFLGWGVVLLVAGFALWVWQERDRALRRGVPVAPVSADDGEIRGKPIRSRAAPTPPDADATATNRALAVAMPQAGARAGPTLGADAEGFVHVGFDLLSGYEYPVPAEPVPVDMVTRIPAEIRVYDGQRVAVRGFMLPLRLERGLATEFLLMRDQSMCCFGVVPKLNDWVSVKMVGRGTKPVMDQPVTVYGAFRVGEVVENETVASLYAMTGEKVLTELDF